MRPCGCRSTAAAHAESVAVEFGKDKTASLSRKLYDTIIQILLKRMTLGDPSSADQLRGAIRQFVSKVLTKASAGLRSQPTMRFWLK